MSPSAQDKLARFRQRIGVQVRERRRQRLWSQRELAERLGLSQVRLSRIEAGMTSLTAEQFLLLLQIFNVDLSAFAEPVERSSGLQNALARYGAAHLREDPSVGIDPAHARPLDAVRAVLLQPDSERLVTALAPVLIVSADSVPLPVLQHELERAGVPNRLGWVVENTAEACESVGKSATRRHRRLLRRANLVLGNFLAHLEPSDHVLLDPFEHGIVTEKTHQRIWKDASPLSRKWRIASSLRVEDFEQALGEALVQLG